MNRLVLLLSLCMGLGLVSCGPTYFSMGVDLRSPAKSGIALSGKNLSVSYIAEEGDSLFLQSVAEGFATALEKDYFGGEPRIGIYRIDNPEGADYTCRDSMFNLLMDTGVDVAFLFKLQSVEKPEDSVSNIPFGIGLYVYDGMNKSDSVQTFEGKSSLNQAVDISEQGLEVGRRSASSFVSSWTNKRFTFYYYDSNYKWSEAASLAADYKFREAMDIWMSLLDTGNLLRRSCAEFNIAAVCCISGDAELAKEWLDRSDADYRLPGSSVLRDCIGGQANH